eukprot:m.47862 g.47862  ORF g.47862 m.47862 type:complete len:851 (-) comp11951_c0_seq1:94-2646(-)
MTTTMSAACLVVLVVVAAAATVSAQFSCNTTQVGCFSDYEDGRTRVLPLGPIAVRHNSQKDCALACFAFAYNVSGVEDGTQCFCGSSVPPSSKSEPANDCQAMKCPGDSGEGCGGNCRILVSKSECTGTRSPNFHGCLTPKAKALKYCDTSLTHEERVQDLMSHLSLAEKIAAIAPQPKLGGTCACHTSGVERIGFPNWSWLVEANTAIAAACAGPDKCATTFSGPMGMGASFNKTSWYLKGSVLGTEMRAFSNAGWHRGNPGDFVALTGYGPNINIARDPRFGRSSELPGEDPFLNGIYAKHMIQGMQEKDAKGYPKMLAYLKHFTAYSRETNRGHDTYNISTHDLFETYLAQYKIAYTEGNATGAMCSYNAINGFPSCANDFILNQVVRKMWGRPDAHVTTDCGAVSNLEGPPVNAASGVLAASMTINNGTDIEMGSTIWADNLEDAVHAGATSEAAVDVSFRRSYLPHFIAGRFDPLDEVSWTKITTDVINSTAHQQIQYEAALQSFVLLKNDGGLPLKTGSSVAVLGPMGETRAGLLSDYAGDQQCFTDFDCIPTIAEAIRAANSGGQTTDASGVDINSKDISKIGAAVDLAKAADVVVLVLGQDKSIEHEGHDRTDTALPGMQELFANKVLAVGKPTILVLCNGGALAIDNLMTGPAAIVEAFNPSVKGPSALAATLFGSENRWGKLPVTMYPHDYINQQPMTNYDMSKAPGRTYRYYQAKPLWPFGYGLSMTTFEFTCTTSSKLSFSCTVTNKGTMDGDEVLQVYHAAGADVRAKAKHPVPIKSLVAFERMTVAASSSATVKFDLSQTVLELINEDGKETLYTGSHDILISNGVLDPVVFHLTV